MATQNGDLEHRLARLEALFLALFLADTDMAEDRAFVRHLLMKWYEAGPPFPHWPELDDLLRHWRPRRLKRDVDALRNDVQELREIASRGAAPVPDVRTEEIGLLRQDVYAFINLQALGVTLAECPFHRPLALRVYLATESATEQERLSGALQEFADALGFEPAAEFPAESGSWYKRWFARSKQALAQPEVLERLKRAERALEMVTLHRHQAAVDKDQAAAASSLLTSLEKVPNAVCQIGSVLVVKITDNAGPRVFTRTLNQDELIHIERNQHLLKQPECILEALSRVGSGGTTRRSELVEGSERGG